MNSESAAADSSSVLIPAVFPRRATPAVEHGGRDRVFEREGSGDGDFQFNEETVAVFDDMVDRSVPYYPEIQRMACEIAADFATPGSKIYDLGVSTGTTLLHLEERVEPSVHFIGVDSSEAMLRTAEDKLAKCRATRPVDLVRADLENPPEIAGASVVLLILTLQFLRPVHREPLIRRIYDGLEPGGCLILVEKIIPEHPGLNRLFIKYYYDMKRRAGYSEDEIARKREALENVLIPYRPQENEQLLRQAGFSAVEEFFRWYNFSGLVALK